MTAVAQDSAIVDLTDTAAEQRIDSLINRLTVTDDQLAIIKETIAKDATPAELQLYLYDCKRQGVHPLDRLFHFTKRKGKYTPVTSIDLMRSRAAETKEHAGTDDAVFGGVAKSDDFIASVTVWRFVQGQRVPFVSTARWSEYKPPAGDNNGDFMWAKMPHTMLGKCAEALALRKGFPRQLGGVYVAEEMEQAGIDVRARGIDLGGDAAHVQQAKPQVASSAATAQPQGQTSSAAQPAQNGGNKAEQVISEPQGKRLFALIKQNGRDEATFKTWVKATYGYDDSTEIKRKDYDAICTAAVEGIPAS